MGQRSYASGPTGRARLRLAQDRIADVLARLAELAFAELVPAGARRPGRADPTESRVAILATVNTNREIAQSMFLTVKMVDGASVSGSPASWPRSARGIP